MKEDSMKAQDLLEHHASAWREATRHPFLDAVRDGTPSRQAFATWLAQDYLFVRDVLIFQARLLARAPRADQAVLARGLVAIEAELSWFEEQAERRGLDLQAPRHPTSAAYRDFLLRFLEHEPYPAAITALWALERVYLEANGIAATEDSRYLVTVQSNTGNLYRIDVESREVTQIDLGPARCRPR